MYVPEKHPSSLLSSVRGERFLEHRTGDSKFKSVSLHSQLETIIRAPVRLHHKQQDFCTESGDSYIALQIGPSYQNRSAIMPITIVKRTEHR